MASNFLKILKNGAIAWFALSLCLGCGGMFQCMAWVNMLYQYSQSDGISLGIKKTFDGRHPCSLCIKAEDIRHQEGKRDSLLKTEKKEGLCLISFNQTILPNLNGPDGLPPEKRARLSTRSDRPLPPIPIPSFS